VLGASHTLPSFKSIVTIQFFKKGMPKFPSITRSGVKITPVALIPGAIGKVPKRGLSSAVGSPTNSRDGFDTRIVPPFPLSSSIRNGPCFAGTSMNIERLSPPISHAMWAGISLPALSLSSALALVSINISPREKSIVIVLDANTSSASNPSSGDSGIPTVMTAATGAIRSVSAALSAIRSQRGELILLPVIWNPVIEPHGLQPKSAASEGEITVTPPAVSTWKSLSFPPAVKRIATPFLYCSSLKCVGFSVATIAFVTACAALSVREKLHNKRVRICLRIMFDHPVIKIGAPVGLCRRKLVLADKLGLQRTNSTAVNIAEPGRCDGLQNEHVEVTNVWPSRLRCPCVSHLYDQLRSFLG
jgi:hypothetical protein